MFVEYLPLSSTQLHSYSVTIIDEGEMCANYINNEGEIRPNDITDEGKIRTDYITDEGKIRTNYIIENTDKLRM